MSRTRSTPNLPSRVPKGHNRGSTDGHLEAAREATEHRSMATPHTAIDSYTLRSAKGIPPQDTRAGAPLEVKTDLGEIARRANGE